MYIRKLSKLVLLLLMLWAVSATTVPLLAQAQCVNLAGQWLGMSSGTFANSILITQSGCSISGTLSDGRRIDPISGSISGSALTFTRVFDMLSTCIPGVENHIQIWSGTVSPNGLSLSGTLDHPTCGTYPWNAARSSPPPPPSAPLLTVQPTSVDFGCSVSGQSTARRVTVRNDGPQGSVLSGMVDKPTAAFIVTHGLGAFVLQSGASQTVEITLPAASPSAPGTMTVEGQGVSPVDVALQTTIDYDLLKQPYGNRLVPHQQPSECLCWATSALTMIQWRGVPVVTSELDVAKLADSAGPLIGRSYFDAYTASASPQCTRGLSEREWNSFVVRLGFTKVIQGSASRLSPCEIKELLSSRRPALVVISFAAPLEHAVVVIGIHGDGSPTGTYITYMDPLNIRNTLIRELPYNLFITQVQTTLDQWAQQP